MNAVPFERVADYYDFLQVVGKTLAPIDLSAVGKLHTNINELVAKYPADAMALGYFLKKMIGWARLQKKTPKLEDERGESIPKRYATGLHQMVKKGGYKKALRPFVEDQVSNIEVSDNTNDKAVTIDVSTFENYLSEDEKILLNLQDGEVYKLSGRIVGLESSRGEYMKFKAEEVKREYSLLIAYPIEGNTTDDYVTYYKKAVRIQAKVKRKSVYQKPKLVIQEIELLQHPFKFFKK